MCIRKSIVVTVYGLGNVAKKIAVRFFDESNDFSSDNADFYCKEINSHELKNSSWSCAKVIIENTPYSLDKFVPFRFSDYIQTLDSHALQKVTMRAGSKVIAKALKGQKNEVINKFYSNMSRTAVKILKEDIEYLEPLRNKDVLEAQQEILNIIRHLEDTGEILSVYSCEDNLIV